MAVQWLGAPCSRLCESRVTVGPEKMAAEATSISDCSSTCSERREERSWMGIGSERRPGDSAESGAIT